MVKTIKVPEEEWRKVLRELGELRRKSEEDGEDLRDLRSRWRRVFPSSARDLEEASLEKIHQDLGINRLVQEVRATLSAKVRERANAVVEEAMKDPRWNEMIKDIGRDVDLGEVEGRLAELLVDWAKTAIDLKGLAVETARELVENGEIDTDWVSENVAENLQERLNVTVSLSK